MIDINILIGIKVEPNNNRCGRKCPHLLATHDNNTCHLFRVTLRRAANVASAGPQPLRHDECRNAEMLARTREAPARPERCTCDRFSQTGEGPDDDCPQHGCHDHSPDEN